MASITSGDIGFDINNLNFANIFHGTSYVEKPKLFMVGYENGGVDRFTGKGFEYNRKGVPTDGTVNHFDATFNGAEVVSVDKFKFEAVDLAKVAKSAGLADDAKFVIKMLGGNDTFAGGNGDDVMYGFAGNDVLSGGGGNDSLAGGQGSDAIGGGVGADALHGGSGRDTFIFAATADSNLSGMDSILDFQAGADWIGLSLIDANTNVTGDQAFKWVGAASNAVGSGGELGYQHVDGNTYIIGDVNGDLQTDLIIEIKGVVTLTASDFIL